MDSLPVLAEIAATTPFGADNSAPVTGLFYGGGWNVFLAQFVSEKNIDGFVKTIREKIEPDLNKPAFVHTIGDIGYKFEAV